MTDRELLEAAATAAGLCVLRSRLDDPMWRDLLLDKRPDFQQTAGWNPLEDDGDALRLAAKLRIGISHDTDGDGAVVALKGGNFVIEQYDGDPERATRRAIVCAAAGEWD